MDNKALELENEIRKLKLQLLKEELNDKLMTLNSYLINKTAETNTAPSVATTTTAADDEGNQSATMLQSILFMRLNNEFLVWHLVLFILVLWLLIGSF